MNNGLFKKSIRKRLAVHILMTGLLPLVVGLALTYYYGIQALRSSIGANFKQIAIGTGQRVDALISNEIRRLRAIAILPSVIREVSEANSIYAGLNPEAIPDKILEVNREWIQSQGDSPIARALLQTELSRYLRRMVEMDDRDLMGILITDRYGGLVATSIPSKQYYFGEDSWWIAAMKQGDVYVGSMLPPGGGSFNARQATMDIVMPIRDPADDRILGVVKICYGFDNLLTTIMETRIGKTGYAMLFDSGGNPLICPALSRSGHRLNDSLLATVASPAPGWTVAPDDGHDGYGSVVGFAPVAGVNHVRGEEGDQWYTFVRQDPEESYAPAYALLRRVALLGGILIGVLVLSGHYVGSRITRPIRELKRGAKLMGEGQLDHRIEIGTHDELEELAQEFNQMAGKIKTSQEALRNFANAVYHSADSVILTDRDGTIFYANPAFTRLTGYSEKEVIGHAPRVLKSGKNDPKIYEEMWRTVLSGKVWRGELINLKKDGTLFHTELTMVPILDETGNVISLLGTERDITERKSAEEERARSNHELELRVMKRTAELVRSEAMRREAQAQTIHAGKLASLGRIAAGVAHEIGNPLSSISAIAQVLETGKVTREEEASYLSSLKRLVDRIDCIIRSLLTFSRPSVPRLESLDINRVIEEAVQVTAPDSRFRKILIEQKLAQGLPAIQGDDDQLVQVFVNLLINAADAVSAGGKISIETAPDQKSEGVMIIVSDNGRGIPQEALPKIFDPFYTTKGPGKGTGLGLSICRGIIEGLGGRIQVDSEVGKGATFTLFIPVKVKTDLAKEVSVMDQR